MLNIVVCLISMDRMEMYLEMPLLVLKVNRPFQLYQLHRKSNCRKPREGIDRDRVHSPEPLAGRVVAAEAEAEVVECLPKSYNKPRFL